MMHCIVFVLVNIQTVAISEEIKRNDLEDDGLNEKKCRNNNENVQTFVTEKRASSRCIRCR